MAPEDVKWVDIYDCPANAVSKNDCVLKEQGTRGTRGFAGADLVLLIASEPVGMCTSDSVSGYALDCNRSACGRANMGYVNISKRLKSPM